MNFVEKLIDFLENLVKDQKISRYHCDYAILMLSMWIKNAEQEIRRIRFEQNEIISAQIFKEFYRKYIHLNRIGEEVVKPRERKRILDTEKKEFHKIRPTEPAHEIALINFLKYVPFSDEQTPFYKKNIYLQYEFGEIITHEIQEKNEQEIFLIYLSYPFYQFIMTFNNYIYCSVDEQRILIQSLQQQLSEQGVEIPNIKSIKRFLTLKCV